MFPTLIKIGPLTIRTYGFFVAVGIFVAIQYLIRRGKAKGISEAAITDLSLYAIVAGLVGARITYVLQNLSYYARHFSEVFKIWEGGLVFYGGFIAGTLAVVVYLRYHRDIRLGTLADIVAPALALGHFFGRLGCFFAGCCYGAPSHLPWAVTFCNAETLAPRGVPLHPTQLYEAVGSLAIFFLLDWYNRSRHQEGFAFLAYLFFYGFLRFLVEFLRADERGAFILGFSPSQVLSLVLMAAALILFVRLHHEPDR
jgi:phosphatidylglycerol:prolipoprotein diacylglycerol transferase